MKITISVIGLFAMLFLAVSPVMADFGLHWTDHAPPFDFFFDNHIDTHQQSRLVNRGKLNGFLYIRFTGDFTEEGIPIATHTNCSQMPGECIPGWRLYGVPIQATLLDHQEGQFPTWCVDPDDIPIQPGYTHFHWLGQPEHPGGLTVGQTYDGFLLRLTALETFFFDHHGGFLVVPDVDYESHANVVTDCN